MAAKKPDATTEQSAGTLAFDSAPDAAVASFEHTLARLEALVTQLESGELPLDSALRTFEDGVRLTRECQSTLAGAQQKVQLLLQRGEQVLVEDFNAGAALSASNES